MKTQRLQASFARRREAENLRIEKNSAVNHYFEHWGKVTSRYETWTTPEYYEQAKENLRKTRDNELKDKQLHERQEKLRALLQCEKKKYEEELRLLKNHRRPKSISTDVLEKIDKNLKERQEERRRLQLESKLYSRLRYGSSDDSTLFVESKTDNQTLAKLNWLDKQIENQMKKEEEEKESQLRALQLQEESRKREEYLKEREKIQESEIKEFRAIQERHMEELKRRELESSNLQKEEHQLKQSIEIIQTELAALTERKARKISDLPIPYNLKRIKMIIRQRSEYIRKELRDDIDILKRIRIYCNDDSFEHLIEKFEMQYDLEIQKQSQIEGMYESEVKHNLQKWEEIWIQQNSVRELQIQTLLKRHIKSLDEKLVENIKQQKRSIEVQETHLAAIENSNEKLKRLMQEKEICRKELGDNSVDECKLDTGNSIAKDLSRCEIRQNSPVPPKFGRKKIAWT